MRAGLILLLGALILVVVTRVEALTTAPSRAFASTPLPAGQASIAFACFVADDPASESIYRVSLDGSAVQALAPQVRAARDPAWSRSGQQLVFQGSREYWLAKLLRFGGSEELYSVDESGAQIRRLTDNWNSELTPVWSPDGQWLAFAGVDGFAGLNVYRMRADGSNRKQVSSSVKVDPILAWSADGTQIAFTTTVADGTQRLYTVSVDDRKQQRLAADQSITAPAWSGDGRWIGYRTLDGTQVRVSLDGLTIEYLYVHDGVTRWSSDRPRWHPAGQTRSVALLQPSDFGIRAVVTVPVDVMQVSESPDGQWIAYASKAYAPGPVFAQVFKQRVDGTEAQQLTRMDCNAYDPAWSPEPK